MKISYALFFFLLVAMFIGSSCSAKETDSTDSSVQQETSTESTTPQQADTDITTSVDDVSEEVTTDNTDDEYGGELV